MSNCWELVIGLEIHAQLNTKSKLFSRSATLFGAEANMQVSFFDAAMPGTLPILNRECVLLAVKAGIALNGTIRKESRFDRKNYFYPDSPQGYQISQFFLPIVEQGLLSITSKTGQDLPIRIERIHIEQDAGKSMHEQDPHSTYIDLNRAGIPLIEIVTAPDFRTYEDVEIFLKKLRNILRVCNICDGDLEKGSMRCDANISIRKKESSFYGTRVEVKNLNSFKKIGKAIRSEFRRQVKILESGGSVFQETRLYDTDKDVTRMMRSKEDAQDYRYFPDPDLLPLIISETFIDDIKSSMPELPEEKKLRYSSKMKISSYYSEVISVDKNVSDFFDKVALAVSPQLAASWLVDELFGHLNKANVSFSKSPVDPQRFIGLIRLIEKNTISGKIAKEVLTKMFLSKEDADSIVKKYGLVQISDHNTILEIVTSVLKEHSVQVEQYKGGKEKLLGFFVGKIMQKSKGKFNPKLLNDVLKEKLSN